jgi:hypothetical protein
VELELVGMGYLATGWSYILPPSKFDMRITV